MPWLQLSFDVAREQAETFALNLELAGALSVTLGDAGDEPQLEPAPGETPLWSVVTVTALFDSDAETQAVVERLALHLTAQLGATPKIERIEDQVWERVWLDTFKPTRFGQRLWVCPHGQVPNDPNAVIVALDPGLAFGTGHHATTALCLEWLDGAALGGKTVLDFGCGSGILAIAALKLGAARAIAVDHDPQALTATHDNAAANGVAERLEIYAPEELPAELVDTVLANILAGPLITLAPRLIGLLRPAGDLVLSGVLADQVDGVRAAYAQQIELASTRLREEWALIYGQKK
ncbi:50S ribosomal protein L11 methyltransferase [Chromatium okenii]|jgi:ribosomal protein L11 methyltransferase|uniref:Ribosomal protein L11 methyltransferase n=1 Tax=Chromatium okenii TaxID=61644 RepID=A0A2S7XUG5_9GAMM|nr:50S ribosomal protein L11 methyltransferase [Chromatium okenii]MBV5309608.1 50S ribosomal protein L11 methyltransferase [Chromatium okenii]PQJ97042.1 50S ribosomal protein L11 methyltransferase [Chromatium okenii]